LLCICGIYDILINNICHWRITVIKKLYPQCKSKAFNITYDDGVVQDIRFVELLNKYNIKGTFNLNSQLMAQQFCWVHPCGMQVKRLPPRDTVELYKGHEVASHTLTHPYMHNMDKNAIMYQLWQDKYNLQQIFGREICGFAVPFDHYSPLIAQCAKDCGFEYARMSEESFSYIPPKDYYWWQCGVFHLNPNFKSFVDNFFSTDTELALCQIVGHSYDLDAENMWETMENILSRIAADKNIISMTNLEIVRYLKAMEKAEITVEYIRNNSSVALWFCVDGKTECVNAGDTLKFNL